MKKLISILLIVTMILTMVSGCGKSGGTVTDVPDYDAVPTLFSDISGIANDQTVMTVGDVEVPAELYFYWVCYVCGTLEYNILSEYNNYGMYGSCIDRDTMTVDWTSTYANMPLMDYALAQTEETIKYYMSIEELAAEEHADLTEQDRADLAAQFDQYVKEMGGDSAFIDYLQMLGISHKTFDRISAVSYLYDNLLDLVYKEGSNLYLEEEKYNLYATYADHILIATQNMQTGEMIDQQTRIEKYQLALDLADQIHAAADPISLFEEFADTYGEDPGRESNPNGYIYTPGTMVDEFEATAANLLPGEISEPVQSDYGFHIILRRDLISELQANPEAKATVAREYLNQLLVRKRSASQVTYDECLEKVEWTEFYNDYIKKVDKLAG